MTSDHPTAERTNDRQDNPTAQSPTVARFSVPHSADDAIDDLSQNGMTTSPRPPQPDEATGNPGRHFKANGDTSQTLPGSLQPSAARAPLLGGDATDCPTMEPLTPNLGDVLGRGTQLMQEIAAGVDDVRTPYEQAYPDTERQDTDRALLVPVTPASQPEHGGRRAGSDQENDSLAPLASKPSERRAGRAGSAFVRPVRTPPWLHEAMLRWEDLWYGRRTRPLVLLAFLLLVVLGGFSLLQRPSSAANPVSPARQAAASSVPAPAPLGVLGTPVPVPTDVRPVPTLAPPPGIILLQSSAETPGALQLFTISSNGAGSRRIPGTPRIAANPRLSPDGARVAFAGGDGGADDLYTIGLDGSGLRRLTNGSGNSRFPAWSPDGTRLAFGSDRTGDWEIYTIDLDGGALTRLTSDPADDNLPSWSPDGQWLAFQSDRAQGMRVYKMRADGSTVIRLTASSGADRYPVWSPDGRRLAYYSDRDGGRDQLFAIDADGGHDTRLATSPGKDQLPAWSPNGEWLAFASERDGGWGIYLVQIATGEQRLLVRQPDAWAPAWGGTH